MARVNIEESLFKDARFTKLCIKFGCRFKAIGSLVSVWSLGQEHWKRDKSLIPKEKWHEQEMPEELVQVGFVEEKEHGFYVKGAETHFAWLLQRSIAGQSSGQCKNRYLQRNETQRNATNSNETQPPTPSLPPTLKETKISNVNDSSLLPKAPSREISHEGDKALRKQIRQMFLVSIKARYGVEPVANAKLNAQIAQLEKRLGLEAVEVVKYFVWAEDPFYKSKMHDLGLCVKDAEALYLRMKSGTTPGPPVGKTFSQIRTENNARAMRELEDMKDEAG